MPYAITEGVRIYYEVEGQGVPLVLGHGGSDTLEMWRKSGYTDALKEEFQLILFDFRGHGRSDSRPSQDNHPSGNKSHEISDHRTGMSDDVVAVLDSLGTDKAHYFGYSAGARVGYDLALHHAERFPSFILGGMTPYAWPETMVKAVNVSIELYRMLLAEPEQYLFRMERLLGRPLTPEDREYFLTQDAEARIAGLTSLIDGPVLTDQELAGISTPCLVFCGELDPFHSGALEGARHMPRVRFLSLPGLNHISAVMRSDLVVPYVKEFLAGIQK
jgi:pimeloyl-ACP methyl ester carboxylesterase